MYPPATLNQQAIIYAKLRGMGIFGTKRQTDFLSALNNNKWNTNPALMNTSQASWIIGKLMQLELEQKQLKEQFNNE